jgi:hypothetical protein
LDDDEDPEASFLFDEEDPEASCVFDDVETVEDEVLTEKRKGTC